MGSETIHADQESIAAKRVDRDVPSRAQADAGAADLRSFMAIPPYPTAVRRYASGADDELGGTEADAGVTGALRRRKGAGRPLDRTDADRFGSGFGADLSGVRVHTDGEADTIARSVQSVAFTYGSDVYFTRGSFAPGTDSGDHLLAHELAHVVQGSSGRWAVSGSRGAGSGVEIGRADDPAEAAADAAADQVMAQLRRGGAPDPAVVGSLPAVTGEPIARTVRRAGLKSLAKRITGKKKKDSKTRPDSGRLGGASIADLKAASDAAHAARNKPSSSGSSSSSGPERKRRSSSRSSRSRHRDESKVPDVSGEGSESEAEEKGGHYDTDPRLPSFAHGYSQPGSLDFDDDLGSAESEAEEKGGHYETDLRLPSFAHGYSQPGSLDLGDSESSESEGEDAKAGQYFTFEQAREQLGGDSDSESSESEDEEKGHHYSRDLDLGRPGAGYSLPGSLRFLGEDSESEGSEDESEEKSGNHYSLPGSLRFFGDSESDESESDDDDAIFGPDHRGGDGESESSGSEDEEKGAHYSRDLNLAQPATHYSLPGNVVFGDMDSESEDDDWWDPSESEGSESSSEDDDAILGEEHKAQDESEGPEAEGGEPAPDEQKKGGHRAFLIRHLPDSFADETKSGKAGMEQPIGNIVTRLTRASTALALLEGGGTVAAAIGAVRHQELVKQLEGVGEDTVKATAIVRAYVDEQREFLRRQDLPIDVDGKLGDISSRRVHYDSKAEQAKSLVTVSGGKLVRSGGEAVDTSGSSTFHTGNGAEIFVASDTGELHMASHQIGQYHHSSLLAGDKVSVGGEMKVTGGKIDWISNKSGHYMPTQEHLVQFVHWLGKDGVDLKTVTIRDGFGFQGGMTADKFVAGVDEHGAEEKSMGFHALKLQVLIDLYEDEYGDEVEDFLESKGWDVFDGMVLNAGPGNTNASKEVISELKKKFGEPTGAREKV